MKTKADQPERIRNFPGMHTKIHERKRTYQSQFRSYNQKEFRCFFCQAEKKVTTEINKKREVAYLQCSNCKVNFSCRAGPLTDAYDVYAEWADAVASVNPKEPEKDLAGNPITESTPVQPKFFETIKKASGNVNSTSTDLSNQYSIIGNLMFPKFSTNAQNSNTVGGGSNRDIGSLATGNQAHASGEAVTSLNIEQSGGRKTPNSGKLASSTTKKKEVPRNPLVYPNPKESIVPIYHPYEREKLSWMDPDEAREIVNNTVHVARLRARAEKEAKKREPKGPKVKRARARKSPTLTKDAGVQKKTNIAKSIGLEKNLLPSKGKGGRSASVTSKVSAEPSAENVAAPFNQNATIDEECDIEDFLLALAKNDDTVSTAPPVTNSIPVNTSGPKDLSAEALFLESVERRKKAYSAKAAAKKARAKSAKSSVLTENSKVKKGSKAPKKTLTKGRPVTKDMAGEGNSKELIDLTTDIEEQF